MVSGILDTSSHNSCLFEKFQNSGYGNVCF